MYFVRKNISRSLSPQRNRGTTNLVASVVGETIERTLTVSKPSSKKMNKRFWSRRADEATEATIFCSDIYSVEFVLQEMSNLASNGKIVNVTFEDLVERTHTEMMTKAKNVLVDCAAKGSSTIRGRETTSRNQSNNIERVWESITFVGCTSSAADYQYYLEKKRQVQADLIGLFAKKGLKWIPVRFQTKLEIHSMLCLYSIVELLHVVERDETIIDVEFPGFSCNQEEIIKAILDSVDTNTLEWCGLPVEILLKYGGVCTNTSEKTTQKRHPTAVISEIVKALERVLFAGNNMPPLGALSSSECSMTMDELATKETAVLPDHTEDDYDRTELARPVLAQKRRNAYLSG